MTPTRRPLTALAITATLMFASIAGAQQIGLGGASDKANKKDEVLSPPSITVRGTDGQTWGIMACFVLIGLAVGANMLPTKRGHQD